MHRRLLAGLAPILLACSPPAAPPPAAAERPPPAAPQPAAPQPAAPQPAAPEAPRADAPKKVYTPEELDKIGPRPPPEPPLTQEELDLLAMDPATITREQRVQQAYARRRKILQNPDSPMARQIEALRQAHLRGELKPPQLPDQSLPAPESKP